MTTKRWVEVRYKCSCVQDEVVVQVVERGSAEEIDTFVRRIAVEIGEDHLRRSPDCTEILMQYMKIPSGDGDVFGRGEGGTA